MSLAVDSPTASGTTRSVRAPGAPSFSKLVSVDADAIMRTAAAFRADTRPRIAAADAPLRQVVTNLALGVYVDDSGVIPRFESYEVALARHAKDQLGYLPPTGDPKFCAGMARLACDDEKIRSGNVLSIQAVGGTGAVAMAAEVLGLWFEAEGKVRSAAFSNPSWPNHSAIFKKNGFAITELPHADQNLQKYESDAVIAAILKLPPYAVVEMQPCGHNPTGIDPTPEEWRTLLKTIAEKRPDLFVLFDFAYQGYGSGVAADAMPIRFAIDQGLTVLIAHSGSKMFAAYGLRIAALHIVCADESEQEKLRSITGALLARPEYSNPPITSIPVGTLLADDNLRQQWIADLDAQRLRMDGNRIQLVKQLDGLDCPVDFKSLLRQHGMFSTLGFNPNQMKELVELGVYMAPGGRMVFPALNEINTNFVARAIATMLRKPVH